MNSEQRRLLVSLMRSIQAMGMASDYKGEAVHSLTSDHFQVYANTQAVCEAFGITQGEVAEGK